MGSPSNFSFLAEHAPPLADLGLAAEKLYPFDPASCELKLRLLGEAFAQDIPARLGLQRQQPTQAYFLRAVDHRRAAQQAEQQPTKGRGRSKRRTTS